MRTETILSVDIPGTSEQLNLHRRLDGGTPEYVVLDACGDVILDMPPGWTPSPFRDASGIPSEVRPQIRDFIHYLVSMKREASKNGFDVGKHAGRREVINTIHDLLPMDGLMTLLGKLVESKADSVALRDTVLVTLLGELSDRKGGSK